MNILMDSSSSESEEEQPQIRRRRQFRPRINMSFRTTFEFNQRFRMSSIQMEFVLQEIGGVLESPTQRNQAMSAKLQICVAIHWLGTGCQYHAVGDMHGVSAASVCKVVHAVVYAINRTLFEKVVNWPDDMGEVVEQFHRIAGMPLTIGCIDGTLIPIDAPHQREDQYVDRHNNHSINCMAVCGPNGKFYFICARWPGSVHDSRVLRNSVLFRRMEAGWRPVPNCVILGDSGYPLLNWLLTPTGSNLELPEARRYNIAHKSTRRIIENAFGILKEKIPCLNYLRVNPIFACEVFKSCTVLCNISRTQQDEIDVLREQNELNQANNGENEEDAVQDREGQRRLQEMILCFRN